MKVLKVIGKIVKWYGILTAGIWAFIGISEGFREQIETDNGTISEMSINVWDKALQNYKDWWNWLSKG